MSTTAHDTKSILVVDDDADMRRLVDLCLQGTGYETVFSADGISAVQMAREQRPDLIVLDIGLPAGDAFTVMRRLNALPMLSQVPVIVVSGRDRATYEPEALAAGAKAYLSKPLEKDKFLAVIHELLHDAQDAAPPPAVEQADRAVDEMISQLSVDSGTTPDNLMGEFLHDVRTPLAVIAGFASHLADSAEQIAPNEIVDTAATIERNAQKLTDIVERFAASAASR